MQASETEKTSLIFQFQDPMTVSKFLVFVKKETKVSRSITLIFWYFVFTLFRLKKSRHETEIIYIIIQKIPLEISVSEVFPYQSNEYFWYYEYLPVVKASTLNTIGITKKNFLISKNAKISSFTSRGIDWGMNLFSQFFKEEKYLKNKFNKKCALI